MTITSADSLVANGDDTITANITHYRLDNGRTWDLQQAAFLKNTYDAYVPEENLGSLLDDEGYATVVALRDHLASNNLPLGELEPTSQEECRFYTLRDERLAECLEQFQPSVWIYLSPKMQRRWRTYYSALKHLPEQEGFPWDGGLEGTPWPEHP